jgi:hypothetical protein
VSLGKGSGSHIGGLSQMVNGTCRQSSVLQGVLINAGLNRRGRESRAENLSADLDDVLNEWIEEMSSRKKHFAMTRRGVEARRQHTDGTRRMMAFNG